MNRSWYTKVSGVLLLVVVAVLYILPTLTRNPAEEIEQKDEAGNVVKDKFGKPVKKFVAPFKKDADGNAILDEQGKPIPNPDNLPAWYPSAFRKYITLGLDLQGGVLLQYGVDIYEALQNNADLRRDDIERELAKKLESLKGKAIVTREGADQIVIKTEPAELLSNVDSDFLDQFSEYDPSNGGRYFRVFQVVEQNSAQIVLSFSGEYQEYLEKSAVDQAVQTIANRIDKLGVSEPEVRKGSSDTITVQLPGLSDVDFGQTQQIIEQTAQLQFKRVDDTDPSYMTKLTATARIPNNSPVKAFTFNVGGGENQKPGVDVYARTERKEDLEAFINDSTNFKAQGRRPDGIVYFKTLDDFRKLLPGAEVRFEDSVQDRLRITYEAPTDPQVVRDAVAQYVAARDATDAKTIVSLTAADFVLLSPEGTEPVGPQTAFVLSKSLRVPDDHEVLIGEEVDSSAEGLVKERYYRTYWLFRKTEIAGDSLTNASVRPDENRRPTVSFAMNATGADKLATLSRENIGRRFAIVLDNEVRSAPYFNSEIPNGQGQITLGSTKSPDALMKEAQSLAVVLQAGSLKAPLSRQFVTQVGPQLGQSAINQGMTAALIGAGLVFLFMIVYYRMSGVIATVALSMNLLFLLAVMAAMGATLTLPGIAGIVLTIGTAVDSNILIFERIKEELRQGRGIRQSIDAGYTNALRAIIDANTTNVISALVLAWYGSGPVKGFAVTLLIGIATSVFTSTFVTRLVFQYLAQRSRMEKLSI